MATLTSASINEVTKNGSVAALTSVTADTAGGTELVPYIRNLAIVIRETGGVDTLTVTVTGNNGPKGETYSEAVTVAASGTAWIGPFTPEFSVNGYLSIAYSGSGTGTLEIVNFTPAS